MVLCISTTVSHARDSMKLYCVTVKIHDRQACRAKGRAVGFRHANVKYHHQHPGILMASVTVRKL